MKSLAAMFVIAMACAGAAAQRAQNNTDEQLQARNAPDVFGYKASAFGPDKNRDSNFTVEVGNTGEKIIKAIEWEYILPEMVPGYDKGSHIKFRSDDLKLAPQERKRLTGSVRHYADRFV